MVLGNKTYQDCIRLRIVWETESKGLRFFMQKEKLARLRLGFPQDAGQASPYVGD